MKTLAKSSAKNQVMAFLMALVLVFGLAGQMSPLVTTAHASQDVFDLVKDDGNIDTSSTVAQQNTTGSFTTVITKYKDIATAVMGLLTITMLIFMLIQFTKLGAAGDNEMGRKRAIMGILTTGIATALLGGATIVVGFFWGALA